MVKFAAALSLAVASLAAFASAHEGHDHDGSSAGSNGTHSATAGECAANVSSFVIATLENVTFFDTCASGSKFSFTTLLDANKLSPTDLLKFCNSSACLGPLHEVMHEAPLTCLVTYKGKAQNLTGEITELHDTCHKVKDAAKAGSSNTSAANSTAVSTLTPSPTSDAAVSSKRVVFAVVAGVATAASFLF